MEPKNRVRDLYDTACTFVALPYMSRWVIGNHFKLYTQVFLSDSDHMNEVIFREVAQRGIFREFQTLVENSKAVKGQHDYDL